MESVSLRHWLRLSFIFFPHLSSLPKRCPSANGTHMHFLETPEMIIHIHFLDTHVVYIHNHSLETHDTNIHIHSPSVAIHELNSHILSYSFPRDTWNEYPHSFSKYV